MSNISVNTAFLDIRQSRNSNVLPVLLLARVLLLRLGLLCRQSEDLELVGWKTLSVNVFGVHDDDVVSKWVQVVCGEGAFVAADL